MTPSKIRSLHPRYGTVRSKIESPHLESPRTDNGRFTVIRDLRYGDRESGASHLLDLYLPDALAGKAPVIIAIHGGGLTTGSKEMFRPKATELAKRGYAVAAVNYRLRPKHYLPTQIDDGELFVIEGLVEGRSGLVR